MKQTCPPLNLQRSSSTGGIVDVVQVLYVTQLRFSHLTNTSSDVWDVPSSSGKGYFVH